MNLDHPECSECGGPVIRGLCKTCTPCHIPWRTTVLIIVIIAAAIAFFKSLA